MIDVDQARVSDYMEWFSRKMPAHVMRSDGIPVAIGGFTEFNGAVWAYFDVRGRLSRGERVVLSRMLKRAMSAVGVDVFVACDAGRYPDAPDLLAWLGFERTDDNWNGCEVWKCLGSKR